MDRNIYNNQKQEQKRIYDNANINASQKGYEEGAKCTVAVPDVILEIKDTNRICYTRQIRMKCCVNCQIYSYVSLFNMFLIKLSVAFKFILAAAATGMVQVVALPTGLT